ncbi:MAG: hypothetical protein AAF264_00385 [Pseudomonadota bacterium]
MAQASNIEDVLSSIRRLVASEADGPNAARLVLHAADRVTDPEDPFQTVQAVEDGPSDAAEGETPDVASEEGAAKADLVTVEREPVEGRGTDADIDGETGEIDGPPSAADVTGETDQSEPESKGSDDGPTAVVAGTADETMPLLLVNPRIDGDQAEEPAAPPVEAKPAEPDVDLAALDLAGGLQSAPVDEAALRALVADVVREELAGELGERITRNVRKLVRRELRRMLTSDGLD